jgi:hypothetical protein
LRALPGIFCWGTAAQGGGELRFCLRTEPKTFDPLKVEDDASGAIRYLTGGVLVRVNRQTQGTRAWSWPSHGRSRRMAGNLVPLAQRNLVFRWHAFFRGGRGLHRPAIDGPGAAFAHRRCFPFGYGKCRNQSDFSDSDFDHVSGSGGWTGSPVRSGRDSLRSTRRRKKWRCWSRSWWPTTNRELQFF